MLRDIDGRPVGRARVSRSKQNRVWRLQELQDTDIVDYAIDVLRNCR